MPILKWDKVDSRQGIVPVIMKNISLMIKMSIHDRDLKIHKAITMTELKE